jgi:hypothetical protein
LSGCAITPTRLPRGVARQLRVSIQRDDVANGRQDGEVAHDFGEGIPAPIAEEAVEFLQLPALALVSHPHSLPARSKDAAGETEGKCPLSSRLFLVQRFDPLPQLPDQRFIAGHVFLRRITKVRQERKLKMRIAVGQIAHFQALDHGLDARALVSIVCTTTTVRLAGGMPSEKSRREGDAAKGRH